jgi:tetratricopeptide (TPR) repeat protein
LQCKSPDQWTVKYKSQWPKYERSTTQTEVRAAYDQAMALMRQKKFKEAQDTICDKLSFLAGEPVMEYQYACATAALSAGNMNTAYSAAFRGNGTYPNFPGFHLTLGKVAESKNDYGTAISEYQKYLDLGGKNPQVRQELEAKITEFKRKQGH